LNDHWRFSVATRRWETLPTATLGAGPVKLMEHSSALVGDIIVFMGGYENNKYHDEIFRYNTTSTLWTQHRLHFTMESRPAPRATASLTYFEDTKKLLLFGGWGSVSSEFASILSIYFWCLTSQL
jgi:hypothetical protein